jgi:quercetin dioxygenase-like cupin family protein
MPKDSVIIGKIHRHTHLAFLLKGRIAVVTEFGRQILQAPCTFISPAGVKRALYVEEDAIVTTVHLTEHCGEEWLAQIEEEVIARTYEDLPLSLQGGAE